MKLGEWHRSVKVSATLYVTHRATVDAFDDRRLYYLLGSSFNHNVFSKIDESGSPLWPPFPR